MVQRFIFSPTPNKHVLSLHDFRESKSIRHKSTFWVCRKEPLYLKKRATIPLLIEAGSNRYPYALDCAADSRIRPKYALASSGREVKRSISRLPSASTTFA